MAQRVNVVLVDDLDGSDADETVVFGIDGAQYEIDLSEEHAQALREALSVYIGHGRRTGGRKKASASSAKRSSGSEGASASEIRAWARENGWDVPERGRVSAEVREAYAAAH